MAKIAYFDCFSGVSGDMILGALIDCGLELEFLQTEIAKLNLDCKLETKTVNKRGITATHIDVVIEKEQYYRHLKDLQNIVQNSSLSPTIQKKSNNVFHRIAKAEAKIHGYTIDEVHFHEVGAVDTIVDVVGTFLGLEKLGIEKVCGSKINVGTGFVTFSHGKYPVPAPATAEILKDVPIYATDSQCELTTPTGAALIAEIATTFGPLPEMVVSKIGYGAGTRDWEQPNVTRLYIGELSTSSLEKETIEVLETNIDDMNPQLYQDIMDNLLAAGALDVFFTNTWMKKSRPAVQMTVLAKLGHREKFVEMILRETTSLGVRYRSEQRSILAREIVEIETPYGKIRAKVAKKGTQIVNVMPEYEDCKKLAAEKGIPVKEIYQSCFQPRS